MAHDLGPAGRSGDGDAAEGLPPVDVAEVDLYRRDADGQQGVIDGVAVVGIGPGVDDDAVIHPVGGLYLVNERPFVVALADVHPDVPGGGIGHKLHAQVVVAAGAVDARLPLSQQVQVGAVDDQELQDYFNSKSWYRGTIRPEDFSESMLSETEKANIETIKKYE
jgi:hypothetical protein